ncbi:hypothetical protein HAX54_033136 [Datura stramonium]|uniref:Uncharacterized protein n=1 Tax=Datura stramonium TaxID=4076 RepID=A0ABS8VFK3_DATST|nr:hypothetical protein [Datura stramonium]
MAEKHQPPASHPSPLFLSPFSPLHHCYTENHHHCRRTTVAAPIRSSSPISAPIKFQSPPLLRDFPAPVRYGAEVLRRYSLPLPPSNPSLSHHCFNATHTLIADFPQFEQKGRNIRHICTYLLSI